MLLDIPTQESMLDIGRVLYGVLAAILFLFGADLFDRYLRADKRTRKDAAYILFLMLSIGILAYGVYMVFAIVMDSFREYVSQYSAWLSPLRDTLVILIIGSFAVVAERILAKKKKKINIMSIFLLTGTIVGLVNVITSYQGNYIAILDYLILAFIGIFAIYGFYGLFHILLKQMAPQKEIKRKMQFGLSAAIIAFGGEAVQLMAPTSNGGYWVLGVLIEILGWLIIRHYFLSIRSYGEFEWKTGMIEMHVIIAETGISLYYRRFNTLNKEDFQGDVQVKMKVPKEKAPRPSTDLVAGGLVGIKGMLREISGDTGNLENIEIGEKSLIFKQGDVIMALLLTEKNLGVYHAILEDLVNEIEAKHPKLATFNGDKSKLEISPIVEEHFGLN